ncbi:HelD family protein [Staphylospora marina]|uniref:HelD family protein n=1 Tax=Staphylospora marina TaxID=2490858 RepID=UPI0013DE099D|nr:ATP-binding domain-containing protein [Staphylospora marina]
MEDAIRSERSRLREVLDFIDQRIEQLSNIPAYRGKDPVEIALDEKRRREWGQLRRTSSQPYFGRLDFREDGSDHVSPLYIGKFGIQGDRPDELLVIDWRAPVASLFYSFGGQGDRAEYLSPDGPVEGTVYLKRNLVIRQRELERVVDTWVRGGDNLGAADEFLLYRLGESKDHRLRDIVSTIQSEQDRIIRAERDKALVIQGVPGSGKTTVALHRLAYLLYRYTGQMRPDRMVIFAPNRMFLEYISDVLPELGAGDVRQTTFEEWALERLEEKDRIPWAPHLSAPWRGTIGFLRELDAFLDRTEEMFVPDIPFVPWNGAKLSREDIHRLHDEEYRHEPLMKRKDRIHARVRRWMEGLYKEISDTDPRGIIRKEARKRFSAWARSWPSHTPLKLYRRFLKETENVRLREAGPDDLAPLLRIRQRLYGVASEERFEHVVVDEAQDFSPARFEVLKAYSRMASFTILGDLLQNIRSGRGIADWNEVIDLFDEGKASYHELNRSYRSTMEIIRFAAGIIEPYRRGIRPPVPVFRSGDPVRVVKVTPERRRETVREEIRRLTASGSKTVLVAVRSEEEALRLHQTLREYGIQAGLLDQTQEGYTGGISVSTVDRVKGMEFDAVVLADADAADWPDDESSARLLYVGVTRALHRLVLVTSGDLSPLVERVDPTLYESVTD